MARSLERLLAVLIVSACALGAAAATATIERVWLEHGVKIYKYLPGFVHAKSVLVDREVALVGSTNMDYRTFQLHYECGVLFYGMPVIEELLEDMDRMMEQSSLYTMEEWKGRSFFRRTFASILRLFDIWL